MFLEYIHSSLQDGWSSLMLACSDGNGNAEVVRILVSAGAHVNHRNKVSSTSPLTLGDLYPNVRLYSEVDYNYNRGRGEMGGGEGEGREGTEDGRGRSRDRGWEGEERRLVKGSSGKCAGRMEKGNMHYVQR